MHTHPLYNIEKSYLENAEEGPFFSGTLPKRELPDESKWSDFLGFKVASKIGVPAGPLLNARWVELAAKLGFDIVTYKTIRSKEHPAHPVPNMVYIETQGFLRPQDEGGTIYATKTPPQSIEELAMTNSFGIPSRDPAYVVADIARAKRSLAKGQVMIVSVVGTPREGEDFAQDFVHAGRLAVEGGAEIIEADFSCPNVLSKEGSIHTNPESVFEIASRMRKAFKHMPLIIKIGVIEDKERLRAVMKAASKSGVDAICGINTVSMNVINRDGAPTLGEKRKRAGVCGGPIRQVALEYVRNARDINDKDALGLTIMATGGVTHYSHFDLFFDNGADIAMSAIGMMWDPYLAAEYHEKGRKR